ncbi:actin-like ATPase domain-containing protein [Xylariomycetidae sp. FL0641]|nr:actin-like ATPase domain-containing protein [Xylariomycetidae sp. FL0641]
METSTTGAASLPHRTIASIRGHHGAGGHSGPHTPTGSSSSRPLTSSFGSPGGSSGGGLRAGGDDDVVVLELGARRVRLGFAGDAAPKKVVTFAPDQQRRAGDFRAWEAGYADEWRERAKGRPWSADYELWQLDCRGRDAGLVADKLDRELRDAFTKYLLTDSRSRRFTLVLPPTLPLPLLSAVLNTIFHRFHAPTVSLFSSPVMTALVAGTRSGLIIDLGWHETTITAVYEYREVRTWRTVRAGKMLVEQTYELLTQALQGRLYTARTEPTEEQAERPIVSFEECEDVAMRMLWCKRPAGKTKPEETEGLPTVLEHEETETVPPAEDNTPMSIRLRSCRPPKTVEIPFSQFSEPCEATFFETQVSPSCFDDHEIPVHLLVYRALLQLPLDVRAVCMSRIIFTGGCSNIIGLRGRIFDMVSTLAQERGWEAVSGKGPEQYKTNPKLKRGGAVTRAAGNGPVPVVVQSDEGTGMVSAPLSDAALTPQEPDHVDSLIKKERSWKPLVQGSLRVLDSLGPWCGGSLATQLKTPALATVDRDLWLQQGFHGASRPNEVDLKNNRQSVGPNGLVRGQSGASSWTLGVWGMLP